MRPSLLLPILVVSVVPVHANEHFDRIAHTVEVLAGAAFCNHDARHETIAVTQWIDREIGKEGIRRVWQQAVDDRVHLISTFDGYDCAGVLAKFHAYDFGGFEADPQKVAVAILAEDLVEKAEQETAPNEVHAIPEAQPLRHGTSRRQIERLSEFEDGEPWRLVDQIPSEFHGFYGTATSCSLGAVEITSSGDIMHWTGQAPRQRIFDAIYVSGGRLAWESNDTVAAIERTSDGGYRLLAQKYAAGSGLPDAGPILQPRCDPAVLARHMPPEVMTRVAVDVQVGNQQTLEMCSMHEQLVDLVFELHSNGVYIGDAKAMNDATQAMSDRLWYYIDRTIEDVYAGNGDSVEQRLLTGAWSKECSAWVASI